MRVGRNGEVGRLIEIAGGAGGRCCRTMLSTLHARERTYRDILYWTARVDSGIAGPQRHGQDEEQIFYALAASAVFVCPCASLPSRSWPMTRQVQAQRRRWTTPPLAPFSLDLMPWSKSLVTCKPASMGLQRNHQQLHLDRRPKVNGLDGERPAHRPDGENGVAINSCSVATLQRQAIGTTSFSRNASEH